MMRGDQRIRRRLTLDYSRVHSAKPAERGFALASFHCLVDSIGDGQPLST
jgi:hypothetical protein